MILRAELFRYYTILKIEKYNFLFGIILTVVMFFAYQTIIKLMPHSSISIKNSVSSFVVWTTISNGLLYSALEFDRDVKNGVAERIFMASENIRSIFLARSLIGMIHGILFSSLLYILLLVLVRGQYIRIIDIIVTIILSLITGFSLGLIGASISFRIQPSAIVLIPLQFALLIAISAGSIVNYSALKNVFLVSIPGFALMSSAEHNYYFAIANIFIYSIFSILLFSRCESSARKIGMNF